MVNSLYRARASDLWNLSTLAGLRKETPMNWEPESVLEPELDSLSAITFFLAGVFLFRDVVGTSCGAGGLGLPLEVLWRAVCRAMVIFFVREGAIFCLPFALVIVPK